jgi:DNA-binding NarL/FixJ family response regulator
MARTARIITLTEEERTWLEAWSRLPTSRLSLRARIVLAAAEGLMNQEIAARLGASRKTVSLWRQRFYENRLPGIEKEAPRGNRRPTARRD